MTIVGDLLASLPKDDIALRDVRVGPFWTVVATEIGAGLAATQRDTRTPHGHGLIRWAGDLVAHSAQELAQLLYSGSPMEAALGMATVNALLDTDEQLLTDRNAVQEIIQRGRGKRVAIVGRFPFIPRIREAVGHLDVLELVPGPDELPATAAAGIIPKADVVAITGTTLVNKTFDNMILHCRSDAFVLVLGPTSPVSTVLFDHGVDLVAGARIDDPVQALALAGQGAIFRQMRGIRLVTLAKDSL